MKSILFQNGDMSIKDKRLQTISDLNQKMQKTKGILLTVLGELFFNSDIGLDYTEVLDITEKNISNERKKIAIIEAIMSDDNVEKVDEVVMETDKISRKQSISLKLKYKDEEEITQIGGVTIG